MTAALIDNCDYQRLLDLCEPILNIYDAPTVRALSSRNLSKLAPLFEKYDAMCGVSEPFTLLPELKNANIQATRAQALGLQIKALGNFRNINKEVFEITAQNNDNDVYYYDDVYIYLMLHLAQSGHFDAINNTAQKRVLQKLIKYDEDNHSQLVHILYT